MPNSHPQQQFLSILIAASVRMLGMRAKVLPLLLFMRKRRDEKRQLHFVYKSSKDQSLSAMCAVPPPPPLIQSKALPKCLGEGRHQGVNNLET